MKRGIITLLSVLALAFAFAGCGESSGSYSASGENTDSVTDTVGVEVAEVLEETPAQRVTVEEYTNKLSISNTVGVPPVRP